MYLEIVEPPLDPGAVKATVAVVIPVAVAVPIVGAPGAVEHEVGVPVMPVPVRLALPQYV
jgi:hypothetical protein